MSSPVHAERATSTGPVRRCACGKPIVLGGECAACRAPQRTEPPKPASAGQALDAPVRGRLERALGHDFGSVRVHADGAAALAAERAGAEAYTIGRDIVLGRRHYPTGRGDHAWLLAHELVHVVQQGMAPQLAGPQAPPVSRSRPPIARRQVDVGGDAFEQEASRLANRIGSSDRARPLLRHSPGPQLQPAPRLLTEKLRPPPLPPGIVPGSIPEALVMPEVPAPPRLELTGPLSGAPPQPQYPSFGLGQLTGPAPFTPMRIIPVPRRVPDRPLTWADFPKAMPANAPFGAETAMTHPLTTIQGNPMYQVQLQPASRVKARYRNSANRATNGCAQPIAACQNWLNHNPGGTYSFQAPANNPCPASFLPDTTLQATTSAECGAVLGAECDRAAQAESARLLAHEQGHFDLGWELVKKADDALRAGGTTAAMTPALNKAIKEQQAAYDTATNHGCIAASQANWLANIAAGMRSVTIP
jgi:hypothetical protein